MSTQLTGPTEPRSRIAEVDIVRGFALFGVLLVNMYGFGSDSPAWDSTVDRIAFAITHVFFDTKSVTLFSILFGFGFALQLEKSRNHDGSLLPSLIRRLVFLFAIGALHTLFYDGDILMLYAELGIGLLLLSRMPSRWLLILAIGLILVFPISHFAMPDRDFVDEEFLPGAEAARVELEFDQQDHVYAVGSFKEVIAFNATAIPANPLEDYKWADSGLMFFAMMLVGLVIARSGLMTNIQANWTLIARVRNWGLGLGMAAMAAEQVLTFMAGYEVYRPTSTTQGVMLSGDLLFTFATAALAFGYAAFLILAAQTPRGAFILSPLAGVGRMALTVYLTQTLIFSTFFYGYGFGAAFRVGPFAVFLAAVTIFAVQVVACRWWLRRYRFGPVEWLWRSFTYLSWQPMRLANPGF